MINVFLPQGLDCALEEVKQTQTSFDVSTNCKGPAITLAGPSVTAHCSGLNDGRFDSCMAAWEKCIVFFVGTSTADAISPVSADTSHDASAPVFFLCGQFLVALWVWS